MDDYWQQIDSLLDPQPGSAFPGVSRRVHPRHGLAENQLYRCLLALEDAGRVLTCDEIQEFTGKSGQAIRHNNANKVLKRVPELAKRYEPRDTRVRYGITEAGRAFVRYMKAWFDNGDKAQVQPS